MEFLGDLLGSPRPSISTVRTSSTSTVKPTTATSTAAASSTATATATLTAPLNTFNASTAPAPSPFILVFVALLLVGILAAICSFPFYYKHHQENRSKREEAKLEKIEAPPSKTLQSVAQRLARLQQDQVSLHDSSNPELISSGQGSAYSLKNHKYASGVHLQMYAWPDIDRHTSISGSNLSRTSSGSLMVRNSSAIGFHAHPYGSGAGAGKQLSPPVKDVSCDRQSFITENLQSIV